MSETLKTKKCPICDNDVYKYDSMCDHCNSFISDGDENFFDNKMETNEWYCDKCDKLVSLENAVISWKISLDVNHIPHLKTPVGIFHKKCSPRFSRKDLMAQPYLDIIKHAEGPNGLSTLLDYAKSSPLLTNGFIDVIQRIFIPGYESVRKHLESDKINKIIPSTPWQEEIKEILKKIKESKE